MSCSRLRIAMEELLELDGQRTTRFASADECHLPTRERDRRGSVPFEAVAPAGECHCPLDDGEVRRQQPFGFGPGHELSALLPKECPACAFPHPRIR